MMFASRLLQTHFVISVRVCPQTLGWPVRRPRKFMLAFKRATWVFMTGVIDSSSAKDMTSEFNQ
eukprot:13253735-Alexandrium_andersonii.AAC.1